MARARRKRKKREQARRLHQEPIVRATAEILTTGRPTLFRWESACRHGLRAGLCLKGWKWAAADDHAAKIVALALARVGASLRPTWRIGQPQFFDREFRYCQACGGYSANGNDRPWCSEECRNVVKMRDWWHGKRDDDAAHEKARRIMLSGGAEQLPTARERTCKGCGHSFVVPYSNPRTVYCSHRCFTKADRRHPRECAICAASFVAKGPALYCGPPCIAQAKREQRARRIAMAA
jgi:hypothetical protein